MRENKRKITLLIILAFVTILLFLGFKLGSSWEFALRLRSIKLVAMLIVSCCVAYSSVAFQTITGNRILTPAIMGFESVYMLLQTVLIFIYGDTTFRVLNNLDNFLLSVACMIGFSFLLYLLIYKRGRNNMYLLLLVGLVLGILFNTLSSFMQLLIDPNDFFIIQGKMFASFNKINEGLLWYAVVILVFVLVIGFRMNKYLDVLALGREQAISLGLNYNRTVKHFLIIIAVLVSISTALIGPVAFLGLLVTNVTYQLIKTQNHGLIIIACCLVSVVTVIGGQFMMERVFNFSTPISTIINLVGGIYFLYLLLKVKKI
ncbi:iron chelate uptake ABC transporter family permease subunit [Sphingobacterium sp. UT-1RO-CII-1]|uniref:iron chelate uptake ABC transporter family permease subunit n=1 Tax=Sphingobacterium sp. UT-1RO-CII-1 TaxID=2995225 RepID=UPI00227BFD36|nr:iron chelate uptake ABC transporter family permease subunit [Sphingobacterium sp. UT-1RO-CII-1]MCY4779995.1 iron chelate uptake ABC transporter family permease subunit [Sphingobacterium sp. UT-1RO-CII-1]